MAYTCSYQGKPHFFLFLTFLWLWLITSIHVDARDSLKPGESLNSTEATELCSKNGMKLGVNPKPGGNGNTNWSLVSWVSKNVPTPGPFKLEWESKSKQLIIKKREKVYWESGNELEHISSEIEHEIVPDESGDFFTLKSSEELTIWTLLSTGQLINRKGVDVARANMCYGDNSDGGCKKWEERPYCRNPGDVFQNVQVYLNREMRSFIKNSSYGISDCQEICWQNCSCIGFTYYYDLDETGCIFLRDSMKGTNIASEGDKFYMLVKSNPRRIAKWIWAIVAIGATILIICFVILCRIFMKRKYVYEENNEAISRSSSTRKLEIVLKEEHNLKVFSYASIMEATNDFSSENKLGQGGFGLVYKNMIPKISDFGIAKMFTLKDSQANTNRIIGTYGYMSPEYAMEGIFSTKSDVYSFGVLLFEIVSGKRNNSLYTEERQLNLVGHAWELWKEGEALKLVDPSLNNSFSEDEVLRCVHAGLLCVEEIADDRPSMSNIVSMLTNESKLTSVPKKPAYYVRTNLLGEETSTKDFGLDSLYENSLYCIDIVYTKLPKSTVEIVLTWMANDKNKFKIEE
ncbi:hypothetical protein VNO78_06662 [Psophocarpus tetragonolobus]|uniref:Apple domain-containing protein n=1 Tax=Psophocarpus tetragonolobus TaxID=3891 RepID=A0AAN9XRA2_PSOTE